MRIPTNWRWRSVIALGSLIVYALIFPVLYPSAGLTAAALNAIPAVAFGWLFGVRGGWLFGLLSLPANILLFRLVGTSANSGLLLSVVGSGAFTLVSLGVGWVRDLNERVKQLSVQLKEEIVKRQRAEELLTYESRHEPLTNLPNRRFFLERLEYAVARNKRNPGNLCAALYLDLNRFKNINDSLGHEAGDQLLIEVAQRLRASVRVVDTVARMGGDEFAILIENAAAPEAVVTVIHRIQANLALPFEWRGQAIVSGASIGVVMSLLPYEEIDSILRDADSAMYRAKASGGDTFVVFEAGMRAPFETAPTMLSE